MTKLAMMKILFTVISMMNMITVWAQEEKSQRKAKGDNKKFSMSVFKDTIDGKLDMSRFLTDFHGFIPVPQLITEPALGHIGFMFAPVFIQPNKTQENGKYIPPDITAGFTGLTGNKSWFVGGMRMASLPKYHLKYRVGAIHGDINMDYYRSLALVGEGKFNFNFKMSGAFASILHEIGNSNWFIGLEYYYLVNKVNPQFEADIFPDYGIDKSLISHLSSIGVNLELDKRDNVFTPNRGLYITSDFRTSAEWTGSDNNFQNFHIGAFQYFQFTPRLVSGFRFESLLQFGDAPFYIKPAIALRGVPMARYQGDQTYVLETEQRFDLNLRWSIMAFGGLAKAPIDKISFADTQLVHNYGTGFRYLIARKFKLRTGIDVAWSNDDFGWYLIFGTVWNDRN